MHSMRRAFWVLLAFTLPLRANIGDSVAQCVKRYGKPIGYSEASPKTPFGTLVFSAGGFTLVVFLLGDTEVGARISKTDKGPFTDAEMQNIMNAEANPQSPWTATKSADPSCQEWTRTDKARLIYDKSRHILMVTSTTMADAVRNMPPAPAGTNAPTATTNAPGVPAATPH